MLQNLSTCQIMSFSLLAIILFMLIRGNTSTEGFSGMGGCGMATTSNYGRDEDYGSCYKRKKIYLNSDDCDEPAMGHGDVMLEKRWGKLYITINTNLPYAKGGVMHTMWGAYHAFLVDSKGKENIYLGSLVRHGDRFYKLSTELLGDYRQYDEIVIIRKTEDYPPVTVLKGSITRQHCTSL